MEIIPILNEEGDIIGKEERKVAHEQELLHPGIRVLVKLSNNKFVFQRRSLTKETNPGKMTFAATGHVKFGQSFEEAAIEELREETGIRADIKDLVYLGDHKDKLEGGTIGKKQHRVWGYFYGYTYQGDISELQIEENEIDGVEAYSIEELKRMNQEERNKFVELIFVPQIVAMLEKYENQNQET